MGTSVNNKYRTFTSLEQSRKLAEILPPESADMFYRENGKDVKLMWEHIAQKVTTPCWSLATLLSVLPSVITRNEKRMFLTLEKAGAYNLYYKSPDRLDELWETKEEPIDACYEMILNLHELKML